MKRLIRNLFFCIFMLGCIPSVASASEGGIPVGGIQIMKTDVTGNPLEGAVFQIARELQEGELSDRAVEKQLLQIGDENRIMAMEKFWIQRDMEGAQQTEVRSDSNGYASMYGLSYGTYYLVEREAPTGYNRMTEPIRITIHKYSHLTEKDNVRDDEGVLIDNTLHIINVRYQLPDTGNWGTLQLAAGGTGVLFSSAALLLLNRRRWR